MFCINKVGILYNKLISYMVYTLTIIAHDYLTYNLHFKDILLLVEFVEATLHYPRRRYLSKEGHERKREQSEQDIS